MTLRINKHTFVPITPDLTNVDQYDWCDWCDWCDCCKNQSRESK